ncbi:MAG: hypothetical protein J6W81_09925 [Lentisphaeria bacterium]|nr:hypothetical protein [Lentisphaeria bacterium]
MRSWIFYPEKKEEEDFLSRAMNMVFYPGMRHLSREEMQEETDLPSAPIQQRSIAFYCGNLPGSKPEYPSLRAGLPEIALQTYDGPYAPTGKMWVAQNVIIIKTETSKQFKYEFNIGMKTNLSVKGSLPKFIPDIMTRSCNFFLFSPYKLA